MGRWAKGASIIVVLIIVGGMLSRSVAEGPYKLTLPLGLQKEAAYIPPDNPLTAEKIELGRQLFFDGRLSADGTVSCATCHAPDKGFSDGRPTSVGIKGQVGGRNAPATINRLFSQEQFWDGRAASLEEQALAPIQNPIEMGNTLDGMIATVSGIKGYRKQFKQVFGTDVNAAGWRRLSPHLSAASCAAIRHSTDMRTATTQRSRRVSSEDLRSSGREGIAHDAIPALRLPMSGTTTSA